MNDNRALKAHLSLLFAEIFWGLMAPVGKDAMAHGIDGICLVSLRVAGAALLFWTASLFAPRERMARRDVLLLAVAALFGIVFNQCMYTIGLGITSPVNASIVTTSMPIFAMVLSFFILREPLSAMKAGGVAMGCCGAVILIVSSVSAANARVGDLRGDVLCMMAQLSFALYLALFSKLVRRYSVITVNKWMFLWASLYILPIASPHLMANDWSAVALTTWAEAGFVVFFGTFVSYLLMMAGQQVLRPTVVSVYNYVQPIVSVTVSVLTGLAVFTLSQALAVILVFSGVWLVTKSKSRRDVEHPEAKD